MIYVSLFFVVLFGTAGIAAWLGDWSGWVIVALFALMFLSAWPLNKWIFRPKTLHNDQEKENAGEARRQEIDYEKHDYNPHH